MPSTPQTPPAILSGPSRSTRLPAIVESAALNLLATGRLADQMRAAQLLAAAYADHEEQRLSALDSPPLVLHEE